MEGSPPSVGSSPRVYTDETGRQISLEVPDPGVALQDIRALRAMYLDLDGRCRAMGIPPVRTDELVEWLATLDEGCNLLAWHDEAVVGHAVLLPDGSGDHELAIFVHQDFQNAGIGTELCRTLLADATDAGCDRIWLSVACGNSAAKRLFRAVGFEVADRSRRQLTMDMRLD